MKVIQHGKLPDDHEYRGTCSHCRCIVEFKLREALPDPHHQRELPRVACPTLGCGRTIEGHLLMPEPIQS